jgi:DNA polymerase III subunit epsilon
MQLLFLLFAGFAVIIFIWSMLKSKTTATSQEPAERGRDAAPEPPPLVRNSNASDQTKVREQLPPQAPNTGLAAFVDVETTGLSIYTDEVIELAADLFVFNRHSGEVVDIVQSYCGYREPSVPINPHATAVHHITHDMVRGQRLNEPLVRSVLDRAEFVIAHNAHFDRKFTVPLFPEAAVRPWLCSMRHVNWHAEGCEARNLPALLEHFGISRSAAHRAGSDSAAGLALLMSRSSDGRPFLWQIVQAQNSGQCIEASEIRKSPARYRPKTEFETRTSVVTTGPLSIRFTSTVPKQQQRCDPAPAIADLMALLKDIVADGIITEEEAKDLDRWLIRNADLTDGWPVNVLAYRMRIIMQDGRIDESELEDLRETVLQITHPESLAQVDVATVKGLPLTQPPPRVIFPSRTFVFSGRFLFGTRAMCAAWGRRWTCADRSVLSFDLMSRRCAKPRGRRPDFRNSRARGSNGYRKRALGVLPYVGDKRGALGAKPYSYRSTSCRIR